ncbi:hypothetical protein IF1G_07648 [Cordyceps javanica]|uniref:Uncharacterized protein n=1 Tax=Cordyceps javanica TaxID=43265 RepID=A0A545UWT2_9HYPO|nr:hypothetical protein IF1G_07648 [Cordyceps javanica]
MILLIQLNAHSDRLEKRGLTSRTTDRGLASPDLGCWACSCWVLSTFAGRRCTEYVFYSNFFRRGVDRSSFPPTHNCHASIIILDAAVLLSTPRMIWPGLVSIVIKGSVGEGAAAGPGVSEGRTCLYL